MSTTVTGSVTGLEAGIIVLTLVMAANAIRPRTLT